METIIDGNSHFGEVITADGATNFTGIEMSLPTGDSIDVKFKGTIEEVCQAKGCWMTLVDTKEESSVFIKFKDYGFFVPKDAGGKEAIVRGKVFVNETSVEELRHYAEDKGATKEEIAAITAPKREVKMMADGVLILE